MEKRDLISLEEALERLLSHIPAPAAAEEVPTALAPGRVLAQDLRARLDLPPFDRSPLDGYALRSADLAGAGPDAPAVLTVIGKLYAGDAPAVAVGPRQAVRLMTGAPIPPGADAVIRQEDTDEGEHIVRVYASVPFHANLCFRGEEIRAGTPLVPRGTRLGWTHMGALAAQGFEAVPVYPRPRVAVLSTGSELVAPSGEPAPGKIYDSNGPLLCARLAALGAEPVLLPPAVDEVDAVAARIASARDCGLILTTGGVSVGQRDCLPRVAEALGAEVMFHGVAAKPGTPTMAMAVNGTPVLALSGNPFAALAMFEFLGRPAVGRLAGVADPHPPRLAAVMGADFAKAPSFRRLVRARLDGETVTFPHEGHASGMVTGLMGCNCLIDIPPNTPPLHKGDRVEVVRMD